MANTTDDNQKWQMPEKYRVTPELKTARERMLLEQADAEQIERAALIDAPFADQTPNERARGAASITVQSLTNSSIVSGLTSEQNEQLAEAYAALGFYLKASDVTRDNQKKAIYEKYWEAVWLDDAEWCEHPPQHKYLKEMIYSVREKRERPLLACNACGIWNVMDAPENLTEAQKRRADVRRQTKGMSQEQVKRFLERNFQ